MVRDKVGRPPGEELLTIKQNNLLPVLISVITANQRKCNVPECTKQLLLWYDWNRRSTGYNAKQIVPTADDASSMLFYQLLQRN